MPTAFTPVSPLTPAELTARLRVLLPESYQVFDGAVQPRSMGSAGLKFGPDGKVLWGEMWASFCHLAMAGGPPHRGKLLAPAQVSPGATDTPAYRAVVAEIARGIGLVTGLCAEASPAPGWLRMYCTSAAMCSWLERAIVMENVSAIAQGLSLYLPAGPDFRVEKEIKNVITGVAKTCHYWQDHTAEAQRDSIAALLASMQQQSPLVPLALAPSAPAEPDAAFCESAETVTRATGLQTSTTSGTWLGLDCRSVPAAVWMMRALCACNLLARREEATVLVPWNSGRDPAGKRTCIGLIEAQRLATAFHVFEDATSEQAGTSNQAETA